MFGVHWDEQANPLCPVCDCLMPIHHREDDVDVLWCPRCKTLFSLWEDSGERVSLETAKAGIAFYRP
jgi:Zn-finger nucleic acid-binding protein